jgi:hydroxybutyrate-dimer hydrolase
VIDHSRSLYDAATLLTVYQGCANLLYPFAPLNFTDRFFGETFAANRCTSLFEKGLLTEPDLAGQAAESQAIINAFGILPEQNIVQPSHWWISAPQAIAVTYANAYGRMGVEDNLCDYSFAATDIGPLGSVPPPPSDSGNIVVLDEAAEAVLFGTSIGIPPTAGINIINNASVEGPKLDRQSIGPSTLRKDENLDGALCLRALATGKDPVNDKNLKGRSNFVHKKIKHGIRKIRASGKLHGTPALLVTGRNDAVIPLNHSSRAYYGLNQSVEGENSKLRYFEVTNAQHFDTLNAFPGFDNQFIPLQYYFIQVMDILFDHLKNGTPLPPSQVVRTSPRGGEPGAAPPIDASTNLPSISPMPEQSDLITFEAGVLFIPE